METRLKQSFINEVQYQNKMLNNLKRWLRNVIIFSSLSLILIISGPSVHPFIKIIGIIMMIISVVSAIVIGLGLRNGKDNIEKLLDSVNKQKFH
jgi:hypothetical protein